MSTLGEGTARDGRVYGVRTLTSTACDNTLPSIFFGDVCHEVVGAANFEAEDLLEVFAFEPYLISQFRAEVWGEDEGCLFEYLVDF